MSVDWGARGARPWREVRGPHMRPPSRLRTKALLVLVAGAVGFLVGVQAREAGERAGRLAYETPEDLTRILADLNAEADRLGAELAALRVKQTKYGAAGGREDVVLEDAREQLADLQVLAGTTPVHGPGLSLTLADQGGRVTWDQLLDLVQELRDAGAEAIAVGGARVVASTWLGPGNGGVAVDGTVVRPPYRLDVVGDARAIEEALRIPGGPLTLLESQGAGVTIASRKDLRLPALRRTISFRYARPSQGA